MAEERFAFGKNWSDYVEKHFSEERVSISQAHLLDFLGIASLAGKTVLDIGCGSGLHSLAALRAGASRIVSFDYDLDSVATTRRLREHAGSPARWEVLQGSVLDLPFIEALPTCDLVYSWGVLHHTGDQWTALRNAASRVAPGGDFYIALYTSDAYIDPPPEFWLRVKKRYNRAGWAEQRWLELWYIARFQIGWNPLELARVVGRALSYRKVRGMAFYTDVKDWLGGWPMEFSSIAEVKRVCGEDLGFKLRRMKAGEANTEYLFSRPA